MRTCTGVTTVDLAPHGIWFGFIPSKRYLKGLAPPTSCDHFCPTPADAGVTAVCSSALPVPHWHPLYKFTPPTDLPYFWWTLQFFPAWGHYA